MPDARLSRSASHAWLNQVTLIGPEPSATVASTIVKLRRRVRCRRAVRTSTTTVACSPSLSSAISVGLRAVAVVVRVMLDQVPERPQADPLRGGGELLPDPLQIGQGTTRRAGRGADSSPGHEQVVAGRYGVATERDRRLGAAVGRPLPVAGWRTSTERG